jgi:hypothetical protein
MTLAGACVPAAHATAPPVGPLPTGPTRSIELPAGRTFTVTLPAPSLRGGVWRIARSFDADVVRQVSESETGRGLRVSFRTVAPGATRIVFALTRGETRRAYAASTFRVTATPAPGARCPQGLLALGDNPIGPAAAAALAADPTKNRPQVTGAIVAASDPQRGPQVRVECGERIARRTVVVYITDRALLPAESASQRVVLVGRTKSGYDVWRRVH